MTIAQKFDSPTVDSIGQDNRQMRWQGLAVAPRSQTADQRGDARLLHSYTP